MLRYSSLIALAGLLQLSACVSRPAQPSTAAFASTPPSSEAAASGGQEDDLQCKTVYSTGSRLDKKKVCTTAAERERIAAAAKEFVDNSSRSYQVISGQ